MRNLNSSYWSFCLKILPNQNFNNFLLDSASPDCAFMISAVYFTIKQIQSTFITVGIHSLRVQNYFIIIPVEIALVSGIDELANPLTQSEMPKFSNRVS